MKIKKIIYILAASLIFAGCSNLIDDSSLQSASSQVSGNQEKAVLKISMGQSGARTALPDFSKKDLVYLTLRYAEKYDYDTLNTPDEVCAGDWYSEAEMNAATINFMTGTYTFRLYVMAKGGAVFGDEQTITIQKGENILTFSPTMEYFLTDYSGKGNLSIDMRYNTKNVVKVTAGLYQKDGNSVPGFNDIELSGEASAAGYAKYEITNVPAGNYIAIFKFFADAEKKQLLGTYREYTTIVNGLTSTSECVVNALGNLYSITYEPNGGTLTGTWPGSYTRQSDDIMLPAIVSSTNSNGISFTGYDFAGWYTNPDFTGTEMTFIPKGTTGNLTLYAKWIPKITIMYSPNGGSIKTTSQTDTPDTNDCITLKTPAELGLNPPKTGIKFLGWGITPSVSITEIKAAEYHEEAYNFQVYKSTPDGNTDEISRDEFVIYDKDSSGTIKTSAKIKVDSNIVLYAIWTLSAINPDPDNKNAQESLLDYDGDGLTDWEEVYQYFTDPLCKDTDGDGWTDKQELSLYNKETKTFSPLIADTPFVDVKIDGKPEIYYNITLSNGNSSTEIQTTSEGTTGSRSSTSTNTKTFNMTHGWNASTTHKWGKKWTATDGVFNQTEKSYEGGFTIGFSGSYSSGDTYTFARSDTEGWSKSWQHGHNTCETHGKTINGGKVKIPVRLFNDTQIGYTIKSITIAINKVPYGKKNLKVPLGSYSTNSPMTLRPNSKSGLYNITIDLTTGELEELLKYSNTIIVEISGFQITTFKDSQSGNNDFTEALTETRARTAAVYIDCGSGSRRKAKTYNIAVKNKFNPDAASIDDQYEPVKLLDIFDEILELEKDSPFGYELTANQKQLKSLYGITNGSSPKQGSWYIEHNYIKNGILKKARYAYYGPDGIVNTEWDINNIVVNAGDELNIYFDVDMDEDGVPLNSELIHGSSDFKKDTDGDTLTDYEEIYGWYKDGVHKETYRNEILDYGEDEDNRVYTNPVLADTDGDDLPDWSSEGRKDIDPIFPVQRNNRKIDITKEFWSTSLTGTKNKLLLDADGSENENSPKKLAKAIVTDMDKIFLDITPKNEFAKIQYEKEVKNKDGNKEKVWSDLKADTEIPLVIGKNEIKLRCFVTNYKAQSESENLYTYWTVDVKSTFKPFSNFKAQAVSYGDGEVNITWNAYSDTRTGGEYGGYVLFGKKSDVEPKDLDTYITMGALTTAETSTSSLEGKDEFFVKLKPAQLLTGNSLKLHLEPQKKYWIYLYAYTGADSADNYIKTLLGSDSFTTERKRTAVLCFYAHYVKDIADDDGGCDPQYYWNFSNSPSNMDFSELDLASNKTQDFDTNDHDDALYYTFGGKTQFIDAYSPQPEKFSDSTKKIMGIFSRDSKEKQQFTISWHAYEKDPGSADDDLGYVTAVFTYYPDEDNWGVVARSIGGKGCGVIWWAKGRVIERGERSSGESWDIFNPDYGSITLHWDWSWDVESLDDAKKSSK
ncbi:InlB B-repeat-containing protein [Treponema sp. C6A8]|uniref:InlB B-repeat-containing protein n=1 Tax=Treponema sp. C6A8 TaxID=1410609 RepID=UPI0004811829|nr:InlB B-repeat-containing protein [Treponema sp. C6A8]